MNPEDESLQMHLLHDYTSSLIRSRILYKQLLDCLRSKDIRTFRILVEQSLKKVPSGINVNHVYRNRSEETCLDIACKNGLPEFVQFLLEKGAKVNRINEAHNRGPIHFATENGYQDVLRVLLNESTINPNLEAGQQTALHMAVKKNDLNCAELLLEKGASPNIPNNKGLTAVHIAAMKGQRDMVELILQKSTHAVDLDSYKDYNNETTRDVLTKKLPDVELPSVQKRGVNVYDLKYYLNANDQTNFFKCLQVVQDDVVNNVAEDLIEMAAQRNFEDTISALLERVQRTVGCNLQKAANIAIQMGSPGVLRRILNTDIQVGNDLLLNACVELGIPGGNGTENMDDRLECLKLILDRDDVDVRCTDSKGNTPLHYAARADCREAVTLLLEKGSYIGHTNVFGVPPVADISVSILSQYFDDCIQARKEQTNEYTIEFDYKCLIPHGTCRAEYQESNPRQTREMDILQYIADNRSLKHLLKHPLLSTFLGLKWRRIRDLLFLNFIFYVLLYCFLNIYILIVTYEIADTRTSQNSSDPLNEETVKSASVGVLRIFTSIALVLLAVREILQFVSSPCYYISSPENWLEIVLIILGFSVLCGAGMKVAAVVILLSAWELVILMGQHPSLSTDVEMFKTVSLNFLRFLVPYAFLILAFAFAFFVLLEDGGDENFSGPGQSLFKTVIMLTGEFDANDIPFVSHPIMSHLVFMLFVFLIAIVLFNLLNGLAVSDTAEILGKAELVALISRIKLVSYIENVAIRAPFVHGRHCLLCHGFLHLWSCNPFTFLLNRILIFPDYLKDGKLTVKPYDGLVTLNDQICYMKKSVGESKDKVYPTFTMNSRVIKQVKEILSKRGRESDSEKVISELEKVKERLTLIDMTLNALKQGLENNNFNIRRNNEN
ncbi:PREDICTED: transient receptor potential cation channel protein painless [Dufourea novaeangliae]|uniref:Transient receptor potential cation channel protein painless n=1 Tax=Dufourea novaeangliae TaxID=178035 RepID=A0A154PSN7_DUFNO|nr:PREDICTED: transient receptor potential cation channel protein painless [Dufourea novaeangliae]KZC14334.1 Transient receptor potential cation channel protein painless [Dufourea novaeangliae]